MRSCEFSNTCGERHTIAVTLERVRFIRNDGTTTPHDNNDTLIANSASITFIMNKNGERIECDTNENDICPYCIEWYKDFQNDITIDQRNI